MRIKRGVDIAGIRPEMVIAMMIAKDIIERYNVEFVITSAKDGKHGRGSLHYVQLAIDVRRRDFNDNIVVKQITEEMKDHLGEQFDVVLESTHWHIEYNPK